MDASLRNEPYSIPAVPCRLFGLPTGDLDFAIGLLAVAVSLDGSNVALVRCDSLEDCYRVCDQTRSLNPMTSLRIVAFNHLGDGIDLMQSVPTVKNAKGKQ